jgi:hypothetical protein
LGRTIVENARERYGGSLSESLPRCLEFVIATMARTGMYDEIKEELAESGWNIDLEDR